MFVLVDRADTRGGLDHLEWAGYHNVNIEFRRSEDNSRWWGICLPKACSKLVETKDGKTYCSIYKERPQLCSDYTCTGSNPGCSQ